MSATDATAVAAALQSIELIKPSPFTLSTSGDKAAAPLPSEDINLISLSTNDDATAAAAPQSFEHIVLFKLKENTDPAIAKAMVDSLQGVVSLNLMSSRTIGPIHRNISSPTGPFTLMAYSLFPSKDNLQAWSTDPDHLTVVRNKILPICDEVIVADWASDEAPLALLPGSVARVSLLKLKENLGAEVPSKVMEIMRGIKERFGGIIQISCGENIAPRANGYSVASVAVFAGVSEAEAWDSTTESGGAERGKLEDYIESAVVVDYAVPPPSPPPPHSLESGAMIMNGVRT